MSRTQVATAVSSILKDSGYFHVEETADPGIKMLELTEQADDGTGIVILPSHRADPSSPATA